MSVRFTRKYKPTEMHQMLQRCAWKEEKSEDGQWG